MRLVLIVCAAMLAAAIRLEGQADPVTEWPVSSGSRVRILSPVLGKRFATGSLISATSDTVVFQWDKLSTSTPISTPDIIKLEVARGTHSIKAKGALIGLVVGAGAGGLLAASVFKTRCNGFCVDPGADRDVAVSAAAGGVGGAIIGALLGRRHTDTWVPVAVPHR